MATADEQLVVGLVLVGGRSRRMGTDKALLDHEGRPLAARVLDALAEAGIADRRIAGGSHTHAARLGVPQINDLHPGAGPVRAIVDAWSEIGDRDLLITPCDLPWIDAETLTRVLEAGRVTTAGVALASMDGRAQYPLGWWSRTARPAVSAAVESGSESFGATLAGIEVVTVECGAAVRDADTPDAIR